MIKIGLAFEIMAPILACGADMKGAFALARGEEAFLEDGFGDLSDADNLGRYRKAVKALCRKTGIKPKMVACDLHPGYSSVEFAEEWAKSHGSRVMGVQHHEAHIASAMADNGISGDIIGIAFDGTGFGQDGNIWGGEFFTGRPGNFRRAAHLEYTPMPGADMAVREPYRMAAAYLYRTFGDDFLRAGTRLKKKTDKNKWAVLKRMIDRDINSPLTSSAGRLFDAVASLVLSRERAAFEAELPIELERIISPCSASYRFDIRKEKCVSIIDARKTIRAVTEDLADGSGRGNISAKFHNTMAEIILKVSLGLRKKTRIKRVVLSGGVFQNSYLRERARALLEDNGFKAYLHGRVPPSDSGLPLGQIAVANARVACA